MTVSSILKQLRIDLKITEVPYYSARDKMFGQFGHLVADFDSAEVEIVPWPQLGSRPIDAGTGRGGGVTQGPFHMQWKGDVLYAQNHAVGGDYVTGWTCHPTQANETSPTKVRDFVLTHEANYHPDGGQVFYPQKGEEFVALLAAPGDDVRPENFVAFYCDGSFGIHINAGVWHQPVFPLADKADFDDKQGAVHACVSVDFAKEFETLLKVPLHRLTNA